MAENSTVETTTEPVAAKPSKGFMKSFFDFFGGRALRLNNDLGAMGIFFFRSFFMIFRIKQIPEIIAQVYFIGAKSAQIVLLVGFFTGMVLGLQLYFVLVKFGSVGVLGTAIALTLIREMGPVLAAIMITARAGSAMTAEIGIQRISEQIDALSTMRIDPLGYLVSPRIAAAIISFPILTTFFDLIGIIGAWFSGCVLLGVNSAPIFTGSWPAPGWTTSWAATTSPSCSACWWSPSAAFRAFTPICARTALAPKVSACPPPRRL